MKKLRHGRLVSFIAVLGLLPGCEHHAWRLAPACDRAPSTVSLDSSRLDPIPDRYIREPIAIDAAEGLWFEHWLGRSVVVDASDPQKLRLRGELERAELAHLTSLGARRVAGSRTRPPAQPSDVGHAQTRGEGELIVYGFDDLDAPAELAHVELPGEIVSLTARRVENTAYVYVVTDEMDGRCRAPSKRSFAYRFALVDDRLVQLERAELGDDLSVVAVRGDYMLLFSGSPKQRALLADAFAPTLRVIALRGDLPLQPSAAVPAPFFDALGSSPAVATFHDTLLLAVEEDDAVRQLRYQLDAAGTPALTSDCVTVDLRTGDSWFFAWILGDRPMVWANRVPTPEQPLTRHGVFELSASCRAEQRPDSGGLFQPPGAEIAIETLSANVQELELGPVAPSEVDPQALVQLAFGDGTRPPWWNLSMLPEAVELPEGSSVERNLLGVSIKHPSGDGGPIWLYTFSDHSITQRNTLPMDGALYWPVRGGVVTSWFHYETLVLTSFPLASEAGSETPPLDMLEIEPPD